jgi:hypothetical protein
MEGGSMSAPGKDRIAPHSIKESRRMPKRLNIATAFLVAVIALALSAASAGAAESPWWQVLDGSRPTNLWKPADNLQEVQTEKAKIFGEEVLVGKVEVDGDVLGCMGTGGFAGISADQFCGLFGLGAAIEAAAEFEAALETAYGVGKVDVSGGPAGAQPFIVAVAGGSVPPVQISPIQTELGPLGSATTNVLSPGGSGRLLVTVTNLGNEAVDASTDPVKIVDELPEGVVAASYEAFAGNPKTQLPIECELESDVTLSCTFEGELPSYESIEIEVLVNATGETPSAGAPGKITVSGGGVPSASGTQEIVVSPEKTPFGIERFSAEAEEEGGAETRDAGSHPFQLTTTLQANAGAIIPAASRTFTKTEQPALPRTVGFTLPPGLIGNTTAVPTCQMADFWDASHPVLANHCPDEAAIGVATVTIVENASVGFGRVAAPLFNLQPAAGEPARFGFTIVGTPVVVDTEIDPDDGYRVVAKVRNATQLAQFLSSTVTIWGTPGDPRHDGERGWVCGQDYFKPAHFGASECEDPPGASERAFLRMPVNCDASLDYGAELEPWNVAVGSMLDTATSSGAPLQACNHVPFDPKVEAAATSKLAETPTGLDFKLTMPNSGLLKKDAIAESQPKRVEVTLPEEMTLNPSAAEGLATCSPAEYAREEFDSKPGEGCPDASKIGNIKIKTPLVDGDVDGALYQATPRDNPFGSLLALYMVARLPERGVLVKLAGRVDTNKQTGQIVTVFDDAPQLPFDSFDLHFREGGRAPLVTPPACGDYDIVAKFTPWSAQDPNDPAPNEIITRKSTFTVQRGVDGGPCPAGGVPSFSPGFEAGSLNNDAGSYSPFYMRLTRRDGEQGLTKFSSVLPKGALAKLAGVAQCPQAAVEAAKARTGLAEKASPSCPASSRIGRTNVGAGVGSVLTYVPGQLYLGGPYKGAPLSVVSITPAVAGPFDVGTVVVQVALSLDPKTGEARVDGAASDPIPHILEGIPLKVRDLRVYVDRSEFTTTPTSCDPLATTAELFGSGTDVFSVGDDFPVALSARYQVANCANLGFKPRLKIGLAAKRSTRGAFPRLGAVLRPRRGDANLGRVSVTLPGSELLENAHFRTICTRVQFAAAGGLGGGCPQGAIYGKVKAWTPLLDEPLQGPVYLRSSDSQLPDMVLVLKGLVGVEAVGRIDSIGGRIRTTFDDLPDAPITRVELNMQGGKKGLLVNSTDICRGVHRAKADLTGQNGKRRADRIRVTANCKGTRR